MRLRIQSTGNAGVYLENDAGSVYIDSFFHPVPDVGGRPALKGGDARRADIILITHNHYDHLHPEETRDAAIASGAIVAGPERVVRVMAKHLPEDRLVVLEAPEREQPPGRSETEIAGIRITTYRTYHGQGHNSYLLDMGGVRIFHDADNERTQPYDVPSLGAIDLLLLCPWAGSGAGEFVAKLNPEKWLLIHMTDEEIDQHRAETFLPALIKPVPAGVVALRGGEWLESDAGHGNGAPGGEANDMAEMTENLIRLRTAHGVGSAILWRLLRHFGDSDRILGARADDLAEVKGVSPELARRILQTGSHDPRPEMEKAVQAGATIIPYDDPDYPKPLLHSFDPPAVLYVRGRLTPDDQVAVGIVGTRNASPYGRDNSLDMSSALARGGYTIVSGLARGVDTFAHIGALNAGGRTVGVLGCGFDHMYPEENRDLALEMTRCGAVVTEFSMATPPSRETFPARNRIIAGMVLGLLVIEAPLRSGSLITARLANEIGRTVFAIPGRVNDARSEGCNKLIRDGATMVMTVDDIFSELNPSLPPPPPERPTGRRQKRREGNGDGLFKKSASNSRPDTPGREADTPGTVAEAPAEALENRARPKLEPDHETILAHMTAEWRSIDDIIADSGLPSGRAAAILALLKLKRLVDQGPGQTYRLR